MNILTCTSLHSHRSHIEGKQESQNLLELPYDLFSNMPRLSTIQFAVHENLTTLPPLTGVPNLQSMTLAWLLSLRELPSLVQVPRLKRLVIAIMPQFEKMPDMSTLQSLEEFVITRPSHICCNGFSGLCDLNDASCVEDVANSIPAATCLNNTAFDGFVGTEMAFQKVGSTICPPLPPGFNPVASIPTKETIEMCDHRPFGQCHMPNGLEGMCYNTRMQVLACLPEPIYIALRRYQIQIGIACNSSLEEWLGCSQ
ncbi:unnamed protein product [Phytophthora lilii]|uniref:Unnamed protein product n=1 Tax=Phytophthora lilii TaxID=2077276 RepID=A0A9W6THZ9_9STRA|nr:unnamed protein product [Phytophthora lilii]